MKSFSYFVLVTFAENFVKMGLEVGDRAPDFHVKDQEGNDIRLKDYRGHKLILYFYPRDNTPGCTKQACNLRDNYQLLQEKGYKILGVSADSAKKHLRFIDKYKLPFPLIVDEEKELINKYGCWGQKKFMGRTFNGILRTTFVIDENGLIENIIRKVKTADHSAQILNKNGN